jgi:dTDP-4-dehydrorhamnose 3,5-epimerase
MVIATLMITSPTAIPDVLLIQPAVHADERGFFIETYQKAKFMAAGIAFDFVQDNHSRSKKGTLRGLHYQIQRAQGKLVRVILGEVFDVAVDLRKSSKYFGQWVGFHLSAENKLQLWIPPGFAHGFLTLSEWAEFIYKTTDYYSPMDERTIKWNDPDIGIEWPIPEGITILQSDKDRNGIPLASAEVYP